MPTLATGSFKTTGASGPQAHGREAGFSLVELLAVLAIMSLMVAAVVVGRPRGPTPLDRDTQRMAAQLQRFLGDAALAGETRALGASTQGLSLYTHDGRQWIDTARLDWPSDARVELVEDERVVKLSDEPAPLYRFEPYGAVPDMTLRLRGREATFLLSTDARGRIVREVER